MNRRNQIACIWCGLIFIPLFLLGFGVVAGFIPPAAPRDDAEQVARMFAENRGRIRLGMWITMGASALMLPFFSLISVQLRRIEGARAPTMATLQAVAGGLAVLELIFPLFFWQAAAYRADRSAESVQLMNDVAWLLFIGLTSTFVVQLFAIAVAILCDRTDTPVFPRWSAYLNVWAALGIAPGSFVVFVDNGPLAWDGLVFWLLVISFLIWILAMAFVLFRAVNQAEQTADPVQRREPEPSN